MIFFLIKTIFLLSMIPNFVKSYSRIWWMLSGDSRSQVCGSLELIFNENISLHIASNHNCFVNKSMSFETCRLLLVSSTSCTFLHYLKGSCSIYQRIGILEGNTSYQQDFSKGILVKKFDKSVDTCYGEVSPHIPTAKNRFLNCIGTANRLKNSKKNLQLKSLPRLLILISVTADWVANHKSGVTALVSNFECYAKVHNYEFKLNIMEPMSLGKFFYTRHKRMILKYLPKYQHVLHLDADSLVLNLSRSLDSYLASPEDIHLHMHENGEVTASAYLVRNTLTTRCFFRFWSDCSPPHLIDIVNKNNNSLYSTYLEDSYETLNYDNGDLVGGITELLDSQHARACSLAVHPPSPLSNNIYLDTVVYCFTQLGSNLTSRISSILPMVKLYLAREGFWRTHARRSRFGTWWDDWLGSCFPSSDLIGHGWKAMPRIMWGGLNHSNSNSSTSNCDVTAIRNGNGAISTCHWHNISEEGRLVSQFCAWKSPACFSPLLSLYGSISDRNNNNNNNNNNSIGSGSGNGSAVINICLTSGRCATMKTNAINDISNSQKNDNYSRSYTISDNNKSSTRLEFDISSELWMKKQLCSTCPG